MDKCKNQPTSFNKIYLGQQPGQAVKWWVNQSFENHLCPHNLGSD